MNRNRKVIGWAAMLFPIVLILTGGFPLMTSLSAYYWRHNFIVFTAALTICGTFLLFYEGYNKEDRVKSRIAGMAFLFTAVFPCLGGNWYLLQFISKEWTNFIHGTSAAVAFLSMGLMARDQFTITDQLIPTRQKEQRNKLYSICGYCIFVSMGLIGILAAIPYLHGKTDSFRLFLILECIIVWAFGLTWLVKGGVFLKDRV